MLPCSRWVRWSVRRARSSGELSLIRTPLASWRRPGWRLGVQKATAGPATGHPPPPTPATATAAPVKQRACQPSRQTHFSRPALQRLGTASRAHRGRAGRLPGGKVPVNCRSSAWTCPVGWSRISQAALSARRSPTPPRGGSLGFGGGVVPGPSKERSHAGAQGSRGRWFGQPVVGRGDTPRKAVGSAVGAVAPRAAARQLVGRQARGGKR